MITYDFASRIWSAFAPVTLLAMVAAGCGSVVVESTAVSSESAGSTASGLGGASAGAGPAAGGAGTESGGTASTGAGGPTDCSAPNVTLLSSKEVHPVGIALDATKVYWVNNGGDSGGGAGLQAHVFSLSKLGGGLTELAATKGNPYHLFLDDTHLYWDVVEADDSSPTGGKGILYSMPKAGGPLTKIVVGPLSLLSLAMDDARFYWEDGQGKILTVPKSGGVPTVVVKDAKSVSLHEIAFDQDHLYWRSPSPAQLMSAPKIGGAAKLLTGDMEVGDFIVDETQVFLTRYVVHGDVFTVPKLGGIPSLLVHDDIPVLDLAQYGPCLYWTTSDPPKFFGREVHAVAKSGGEPIVILQPLDGYGYFHIAVDASGVYAVDEASGKVMKATK